MKNIFKMFGIVALVAVIGFSMAACKDSDDGLPAPTGLTATAVSSSVINLTWNAVAGASGYKVYQSQSSSSGFNLLGTVSTNSATNNNLPANTTLYYKVSAYKANGDESAMSSVASATTLSSGSYSLNGVWGGSSSGARITITGSTGVITAFGSAFSDSLWLDARNKGYVQIGTTYYRNITSTGNLTWSGQQLGVTFNTASPNVATGTGWMNSTFTLSSNGQTLTVVNTEKGGTSTLTRQ